MKFLPHTRPVLYENPADISVVETVAHRALAELQKILKDEATLKASPDR